MAHIYLAFDMVVNKAVYLVLGIDAEGERDVLGLWIEQTEGAKFWLKVFNEIKTRGCQDILIAVVDGLTGLPDAINAAANEQQAAEALQTFTNGHGAPSIRAS